MATLVSAAIPFFCGVYCLLVGFRVVGKKPGEDPKYDKWFASFNILIKLVGVGLVGLAVIYLFEPWKRPR